MRDAASPRASGMTQLSGNRALLQAFLADAQRYLEEFRLALTSSAMAPADAALEAVRGIRIGAEFLEIAPLAGLCRQQEGCLAKGDGALPEDARESLLRAAEEIDRQLAALDENVTPSFGPASVAVAQAEVRDASGDGNFPAAWDEAAAPESPPAQDIEPPHQPMTDSASREPPAAAVPVAEMFQEWMREWRAFREQIERIYLAAPIEPSSLSDLSDRGAPSEEMSADRPIFEARSGPMQRESGSIEIALSAGAVDQAQARQAAGVIEAAAAQAERGPEPGRADVGASAVGPTPQPHAVPAAETMAVLKLSIGPALFGLPAANVLGFVEPTRDVRRLSGADALAAVNGVALPVLDVRGRWGLGERPAEARIVLVESGRERIGLWADRVHGTESLCIQPLLPAAFHPAELGGAAVSAQGEVVLMLRPEAIAALGEEA